MILTMTVANRPHYLKESLASLAQVRGIKTVEMVFACEPLLNPKTSHEVFGLINSFDATKDVTIIMNDHEACDQQGEKYWSRNAFNGLQAAFLHDDFVVHLDDDVLLAPDTLEFLEWTRETYKNDPTVFTVSPWNHPTETRKNFNWFSFFWPTSSFNQVFRFGWFTPQCFGTWKNRWEEMKNFWDFRDATGGYDFNINHYLRGDRVEIRPVISRVRNIGRHGVHCVDPVWFDQRLEQKLWAGNLPPYCGPYQEISPPNGSSWLNDTDR